MLSRPSWPKLFPPQHLATPFCSTAHVWLMAAAGSNLINDGFVNVAIVEEAVGKAAQFPTKS